MATAYCSTCREKVDFKISKKVLREFKGYEVNVEEQVPVCMNCNNEFFIPSVDEDNLKRLYDKYRELANIISPEEIIEFRKKYNISQRELVAILDWGKMTVNRFERGSIPSSSHNDLLKLIMSNELFFKEKAEEAFQKGRVNQKTYDKVQQKLNNSINQDIKKLFIQSLTHKESEYNGFRKFDIERLTNLIGYISEKVDLYKTSLNKYLWYIDFENFRRNIRSLTGLQYMKYTHGPVIEDFKYEELLNLYDDKFTKIEFEQGNNVTTEIKSKNNYDLTIFKQEEIKVINDVIAKFKSKNCTEISKLSHEELGWLENEERELINYNYAEKLKVNFEN